MASTVSTVDPRAGATLERLGRWLDNRTVLSVLFMFPAAALLLSFLTYPLVLGIWMGFTDVKSGRPGVFIGLENYISLFNDGVFLLSVFNTIVYTVVATIRDHGRWRPARGEHRGRGGVLMRALCDQVDIQRGPAGTTVTLHKHIGGAPP